jgi:hypothetical protein
VRGFIFSRVPILGYLKTKTPVIRLCQSIKYALHPVHYIRKEMTQVGNPE